MEYFIFIFFSFLAFLSWMWGRHIEWMEENHPDLKNNKTNDYRPSDEDN